MDINKKTLLIPMSEVDRIIIENQDDFGGKGRKYIIEIIGDSRSVWGQIADISTMFQDSTTNES